MDSCASLLEKQLNEDGIDLINFPATKSLPYSKPALYPNFVLGRPIKMLLLLMVLFKENWKALGETAASAGV